MQIVIDIAQNEYDALEKLDAKYLLHIIKDGTPLPKGHGRLIDKDQICKDIISALGIKDDSFLLQSEKAIYKRIEVAQTIIEADKEEAEQCDDDCEHCEWATCPKMEVDE